MRTNMTSVNRLRALEDYIVQEFNGGTVHHSELMSICNGYKYSYATGCVICKRHNIKIK